MATLFNPPSPGSSNAANAPPIPKAASPIPISFIPSPTAERLAESIAPNISTDLAILSSSAVVGIKAAPTAAPAPNSARATAIAVNPAATANIFPALSAANRSIPVTTPSIIVTIVSPIVLIKSPTAPITLLTVSPIELITSEIAFPIDSIMPPIFVTTAIIISPTT